MVRTVAGERREWAAGHVVEQLDWAGAFAAKAHATLERQLEEFGFVVRRNEQPNVQRGLECAYYAAHGALQILRGLNPYPPTPDETAALVTDFEWVRGQGKKRAARVSALQAAVSVGAPLPLTTLELQDLVAHVGKPSPPTVAISPARIAIKSAGPHIVFCSARTIGQATGHFVLLNVQSSATCELARTTVSLQRGKFVVPQGKAVALSAPATASPPPARIQETNAGLRCDDCAEAYERGLTTRCTPWVLGEASSAAMTGGNRGAIRTAKSKHRTDPYHVHGLCSLASSPWVRVVDRTVNPPLPKEGVVLCRWCRVEVGATRDARYEHIISEGHLAWLAMAAASVAAVAVAAVQEFVPDTDPTDADAATAVTAVPAVTTVPAVTVMREARVKDVPLVNLLHHLYPAVYNRLSAGQAIGMLAAPTACGTELAEMYRNYDGISMWVRLWADMLRADLRARVAPGEVYVVVCDLCETKVTKNEIMEVRIRRVQAEARDFKIVEDVLALSEVKARAQGKDVYDLAQLALKRFGFELARALQVNADGGGNLVGCKTGLAARLGCGVMADFGHQLEGVGKNHLHTTELFEGAKEISSGVNTVYRQSAKLFRDLRTFATEEGFKPPQGKRVTVFAPESNSATKIRWIAKWYTFLRKLQRGWDVYILHLAAQSRPAWVQRGAKVTRKDKKGRKKGQGQTAVAAALAEKMTPDARKDLDYLVDILAVLKEASLVAQCTGVTLVHRDEALRIAARDLRKLISQRGGDDDVEAVAVALEAMRTLDEIPAAVLCVTRLRYFTAPNADPDFAQKEVGLLFGHLQEKIGAKPGDKTDVQAAWKDFVLAARREASAGARAAWFAAFHAASGVLPRLLRSVMLLSHCSASRCESDWQLLRLRCGLGRGLAPENLENEFLVETLGPNPADVASTLAFLERSVRVRYGMKRAYAPPKRRIRRVKKSRLEVMDDAMAGRELEVDEGVEEEEEEEDDEEEDEEAEEDEEDDDDDDDDEKSDDAPPTQGAAKKRGRDDDEPVRHIANLRNVKLNCYVNSSLQALFACDAFVAALQPPHPRVAVGPNWLKAIAGTYEECRPTPERLRSPLAARFAAAFFGKHLHRLGMTYGQTQDAAQFIAKLLENAPAELAAPLTGELTATTQWRCPAKQNCQSAVAHPFTILDVELDARDSSLQDCWKRFGALEADVDYKPGGKGKLVKATRQLQVSVWPEVLAIVLKRFAFDTVQKGAVKKEAHVTFPLVWKPDEAAPQYELCSLVEHRTAGVHYVAYVRFQKHWYHTDCQAQPNRLGEKALFCPHNPLIDVSRFT